MWHQADPRRAVIEGGQAARSLADIRQIRVTSFLTASVVASAGYPAGDVALG
jgi:hypothetical protein